MLLNTSCDPCTRIEENVPATKWCVDCEDALCITCVKSHKGNRICMTHHVIDIEVTSTLPDEVLKTQTKCSRHPDFIMDFFCNQHHLICCRSCMSEDHRSCDKVIPLEMASNNAKTSPLLHDITDGMKQVHLTLKTAVQNRRGNRYRMKIEETNISRQLSAFKASVIKKLDELEKSAMLQIQTVSKDSISQMEREESELEKSVSLIEKHLQQLEFLTKNGSNKHAFLFLHKLLPILTKEDNHLEEVLANLSDVSLVYDQPENLFEIKHLGTIRLKKEPCTIRFKPFKHIEAQEISVQSKPPKSFKYCYIIDKTSDAVTGMVVDKDDNLILADQTFLRMYSKDGKYVKECKLGGTAWAISYNKKSGRIVVALRDKGILFVDNFIAQTKITIQNINDCRGVTWVDDNVFVSGCDSNNKGRMNILDSNGQHISSISSITSSTATVWYIHHSDNNIYYTDLYKVYCIKKDGSNVFTFSSPDLKWADGIDTDSQGNVYVVGRLSNNILRLSPDGQNSDIIMKKEDGISNALTLCFSRDFKKLFVSNEGGKRVVIYNCEY